MDTSFAWSLNSSKIVFDIFADGIYGIYVVSANGTDEPTNRTQNQEGICLYPDWQPGGASPAPPEAPEPGTMMLLASGLAGLGGLTIFHARFRR